MNPFLGLLGIGQPQQPQGQQTGPISPPAPWRQALGGWFDDVNGVDWQQAQQEQRMQEAVGQMASAGLIPQELGAAVLQGIVPPTAIGQWINSGRQHGFDMARQDDAQAHDFAFEDHQFGNDAALETLKSNLGIRAAEAASANKEAERLAAVRSDLAGEYQPRLEGLDQQESRLNRMGELMDGVPVPVMLNPEGTFGHGLPGVELPFESPPATKEQQADLAELRKLTADEIVFRVSQISETEPPEIVYNAVAQGVGGTVITDANGDGVGIATPWGSFSLGGQFMRSVGINNVRPEQVEGTRIAIGREAEAAAGKREQVGAEFERAVAARSSGNLQPTGGGERSDDPIQMELSDRGITPAHQLAAWGHVGSAESSGNPGATNTSKYGLHAGTIQIGPPLMAEFNADKGTNYTTEDVARDPSIDREVVAWQADRFNKWLVGNGYDEYIGTQDANGSVITYTGLARAYNLAGPGGAANYLERGDTAIDRDANGNPTGMNVAVAMAEGAEFEAGRGSNAGNRVATAEPAAAPFGAAQAATRPQPAPALQTLLNQPLGTDFMPPVPQRPAPWETPVLPMNMPQPAQQLGARPQPLGRRVAEAPMEFEPPQRMQMAAPPQMAAQQQLRQLAQVAQPQMQPQRTRIVDRVVAAVEAEDERGERSSSSRETRARVRERAAQRRLRARRA